MSTFSSRDGLTARAVAPAGAWLIVGLLACPAWAQQPPRPLAPGAAEAARQPRPAQAPTAASGADLVRQIYRTRTPRAQTIEDFSQIIVECERAIEAGLSPADKAYAERLMAWAYDHRGEKNSAAGKDELALPDFDAALALDPRRWQTYHNRGVSRAMLNKYDDALADFSRAIEINPKYANSWYNRAELQYERGHYADAVSDYDEAIRLQPADSELCNSRGHAFYRLGDYDAAIEDYTEAIRLDPANAAAYTNRGDAHSDRGRYDLASLDYRAALRIDPQLGRAYQSAAWLMATCPDQHYRDADKGVQAARKAIELDGEVDPRYLDTLAAALANAGQFAEAQEVLKRAITAAPEELVETYRQRLESYAAGQPFRDPQTAATDSAAAPRTTPGVQ